MKNILFFNSNYAWGGGEKWHLTMAQSLSQRGYKIYFLTGKNSELEKKVHQLNFKSLSLELKNCSFLSPYKKNLIKNFIKGHRIDICILNLPRDVKICCALKKKLGNVKLVYRRGMPHPIKANFLNKILYPKLDCIIANSIEIKKSISSELPMLKEKVQVIYNGVEKFEVHEKLVDNKFVIGNLGRLVEQKGHHHLIKLGTILKRKQLSFEILIAGKGPLENDLEKSILVSHLQDEIKLVGHVDPKQFLKKIDLFVFPSHFEGSANAIIEATQMGIPTIAFKTSSMPEMVKDGETGYLIPPFEVEKMADKIIKLIQQPKLLEEFSKKCEAFLNQNFLHEQKITQLEEILNEI